MADNIPSGTEYRTGRSDSTSSASTAATQATFSPSATAAHAAGFSTPVRRRSSGHLFEGLTAQKRKDDPASVARRQSLNEQRPPPGFIGQMWNNWVRGNK
ncbi:hypothetical protein N656DRAFT_798663 [Canariomyces notabilis]|uniref:Conidiation-specific protein 8 n=1 Tax=Canariomyces notabilis TaxID=2074819 RepID=A0AAN6YQS0_9PEZI|nr:hypothetical protein N656DRAFT_798663 [Canariomyces arenarius]